VAGKKRAITCEDILGAGNGGSIAVPSGTIVTAAARELAAKMNVGIEGGSSAQTASSADPELDQDTVRRITSSVLAHLRRGRNDPTPGGLDSRDVEEVVSQIVSLVKKHGGDAGEVMKSLQCERPNRFGSRVVISSVGLDRPGIMSTLTSVLAESGVNIIDISQTIVKGFFTMIMIVDVSNSTISFTRLKELLNEKGDELGVKIMAQHEEIFDYMHRIL